MQKEMGEEKGGAVSWLMNARVCCSDNKSTGSPGQRQDRVLNVV